MCQAMQVLSAAPDTSRFSSCENDRQVTAAVWARRSSRNSAHARLQSFTTPSAAPVASSFPDALDGGADGAYRFGLSSDEPTLAAAAAAANVMCAFAESLDMKMQLGGKRCCSDSCSRSAFDAMRRRMSREQAF